MKHRARGLVLSETTPAASELERKRLLEICWWHRPEYGALRDSTAVAWETLRRTSAFRSFWEKASTVAKIAQATFAPGSVPLCAAIVPPVRELIFKNKQSHTDRREWLPLGKHDPIQKWCELFLRDCRPRLDWIQLGDGRRHSVRFNSPILPRQERAEGYSRMDVTLCELEHDQGSPNGEKVKRIEWGVGLPMKPLPESGFRVLPHDVERKTYVVIMFELGQGAEALERQLEAELTSKLYPGNRNGQPCTLMDCGDAVHTWRSDVPPGQMVYPKLWAESIDPNMETRTRESVITIPARNSPFVMCWIPARNDWKQLQSRFHNAVREAKRPALENVCRAYWALPEVVPGVMGGPSQTLPPYPPYDGIKTEVKRKAATLKEFWIGLTAFEYRQAGVKFDKSAAGQEALRIFKENGWSDDPDLIRPALGDFKDRLSEIDSLYAKLV